MSTLDPHPCATPLEPGKLDARRWLLRDFVAEYIGMAAMQGQLAQCYCDLGDDAGLAYAVSKFSLYAKAAVSAFNDLSALQGEDL